MLMRTSLGVLCLIGLVTLRASEAAHDILEEDDNQSQKKERTNRTTPIKPFKIKHSTNKSNTQARNVTLNDENINYFEQYEENYAASDPAAVETKQLKATKNKVPDEIVDGRSSFVNNEYILDDEALVDDSPPLYELLQQQMEHILASTGPDTPIYQTENNYLNPKQTQSFSYSNDNAKEYSEQIVEQEEKYTNDMNYQQPETRIQELPKPIASSNLKLNKKTSAEHPKISDNKPLQHPVISNSVFLNGNIHKHKRRISFKTVSTASHIVSTPLADLLFKFSIGIAKPTSAVKDTDKQTKQQYSYDDNSLIGYGDNIPRGNRPVPHAQKSVTNIKINK